MKHRIIPRVANAAPWIMAACSIITIANGPAVFADDEPVLEEVVVTGSLIRGTPIDAATNVSTFDRDALTMQNSP